MVLMIWILLLVAEEANITICKCRENRNLVVEDSFINGRPALEKTGVIFTDRATVDKVEKMKYVLA